MSGLIREFQSMDCQDVKKGALGTATSVRKYTVMSTVWLKLLFLTVWHLEPGGSRADSWGKKHAHNCTPPQLSNI
eukprot:2660161-Amphidinium_carterae.1